MAIARCGHAQGSQRKTHSEASEDAFKKCANDPLVIFAILVRTERKIKAHHWQCRSGPIIL